MAQSMASTSTRTNDLLPPAEAIDKTFEGELTLILILMLIYTSLRSISIPGGSRKYHEIGVSLSKGRTDQVIVVPHCEAWKKGGMSDKTALVNRAAAHNYFVTPIDYFYLLWESIKSHHKNSTISPERFIARCYAAMRVRIVKSTQAVPIMTSMVLPGDNERYCMRVNPHLLPTAPNCSAQCYYEALPHLQAQIKSMLCTP